MFFDDAYGESVSLRDDTTVELRLIRASDKLQLVRGFERMSPESRYLRFFTTKNELSEQEIAYLTEVDQQTHFAMGAAVIDPIGREEGVGVARFVALADHPTVAEPAIAVIDEMQGKGLGRLLFLRLMAAAAERGITQFRCEVLAANQGMRDLLHHLSPDAVERRAGDMVVVKMPIVPVEPDESLHTERGRGPLYRVFSMVAEQIIAIRRVVSGDGSEKPPPTILDSIGNTPLIPLHRIGRACRVPVLVKCEHLNPGGSIKDRMALAIVDAGEASGALTPGATLVEATAGNTGMALAMIAAVRGYKLVCVMPEKMSVDKRQSLRAMGAEVIITDNAPPSDARNFQQVAKRIAAERDNAWLTDQFQAAANPGAHERTTGPEIWEQTNGTVGAFVAGVGTGGTITGVGRFLKSKKAETLIVLADPVGSRLAGLVNDGALGEDGSYRVEGIGSSEVPGVLDASVIDHAESVSDDESFAMARRLVQEEGLLVGGSAGTIVVAAIRVAQRPDLEGPVVALLPDHFDRYQSTLFAAADG